MPFREAWLGIGGTLLVLGLGVGEPAIVVVGLVIIVLGGVGRYWSNHLFDRVTLESRLGERRSFIGESVPLDVTLENRKPLPLPWYEWRIGVIESLPVENEALAASAAPGLHWIVRRGARVVPAAAVAVHAQAARAGIPPGRRLDAAVGGPDGRVPADAFQ